MVFHIGHGKYDELSKLHWFLTTQVIPEDEKEEINQKYGADKVSFITIDKKDYAMISEKLIESSKLRFKMPWKAIFLSVPCQALMGGEISLIDPNIQDFAFAEALENNELGFFMGYDESNGWGQMAGLVFIGKLISGMSIGNSWQTLPYKYRHDDRSHYENKFKKIRSWTADLFPHFSDLHPEIESSILTRPVMGEVGGVDTKEGGFIKLSASAMLFCEPRLKDLHGVYEEYIDAFDYNDFRYGFEYSESPDFKNSTQLIRMSVGYENNERKAKCLYDNNKVNFSQSISTGDLKSGTKYYFRAFFYDGIGSSSIFNYSDYKEFTTAEKKIEHVVPIEILDPMKPYIPIYDGENPPDIQGTYVIDPMEIVYDKTGNYEPGYNKFSIVYFNISNQNFTTNTLDYQEKEIGNGNMMSESEGKGAFISGEGNNFSVYFNTTGVTHLENYDVNTTDALVISGTKTSDGIRDLRYAFVIVKKSDDPENRIMNVGDFRVFKDGDNWAEATRWPSGTRIQQITVRDGIIFTPWSIRSLRSR